MEGRGKESIIYQIPYSINVTTMRHAFNTFLSTSASLLLPSLNAFPFHPCLLNLTRIQPTIIQRVPRRQFSYASIRGIDWDFGLKNIRHEKYA